MPKRLPLPSTERLRELFSYNPDTGVVTHRRDVTTGRKKHRCKAGAPAGYPDAYGYLKVTADGAPYALHRVIWKMQTGQEPGEYLDHKNRTRSDNRWENLREADANQNAQNSTPASGLLRQRGAHFNAVTGKWAAFVNANGKSTYLGSFDAIGEASRAYETAAKELHGDFYAEPTTRVLHDVVTLTDVAFVYDVEVAVIKLRQLEQAAVKADKPVFAEKLREIEALLTGALKIAVPKNVRVLSRTKAVVRA
jgi:hypothetical protein